VNTLAEIRQSVNRKISLVFLGIFFLVIVLNFILQYNQIHLIPNILIGLMASLIFSQVVAYYFIIDKMMIFKSKKEQLLKDKIYEIWSSADDIGDIWVRIRNTAMVLLENDRFAMKLHLLPYYLMLVELKHVAESNAILKGKLQ
jgi:hypothetical protein